ncbi:MAG: cadmium resistance transporter [Nitrososphaeraceae archaeon]|jgi:cadmium resistance protein CadD (predicted permease)|nr:cadmium resistance transporter [Nitrososphaeraceae archaeon]MDW0333027.1 cadmium resistance transporter [Nitrososphaeraceae archaeon]
MVDIIGLIAIGVAAFVATNIDDIFVLMIFFSSLAYSIRQIVLGQYIGIGLLIAISGIGSLIAFVVPTYVIGLMGIVPIAIGIKHLVEVRRKDNPSRQVVQDKMNKSYLSFLSVAAVTFSNGGDNIGVYIPLFSKYNTISEIFALITVFIAMTAVWCIAAYYFVNHPLIASRIRHTGNIILPFVLIGLGIYVLTDSFLFSVD